MFSCGEPPPTLASVVLADPAGAYDPPGASPLPT